MTSRLFGTDGVRGKAGSYPLDHQTVRRLGAALVRALPEGHPRLLIGRDTRESGEWIERELAHGARACGADVMSAGVIPTPGVAYLTGSSDFTAGVVISASHNPFEDNGIKVFSGAGEKFTDDLERARRVDRGGFHVVRAGWRGRCGPRREPRGSVCRASRDDRG